jgi:PKD repeat protein
MPGLSCLSSGLKGRSAADDFGGMRVNGTFLRCIATAAATLLCAAPAAAHDEMPEDAALAKLGKGAVRSGDGYLVKVKGAGALYTHGPDAKAELGGPSAPASALSTRLPACSTPDHRIDVLYARAPGAADGYPASAPMIRSIVNDSNARLNDASAASGGPTADYRVLCDGANAVSVGQFVLSDPTPSTAVTYSDAVSAAEAAGYSDPTTHYAIFYDGSGGCGVGSFWTNSSPAANNPNNTQTGYAIVYKTCWSSSTFMHEIGHNMGAVQDGSPHSSLAAHCWDENDVMCYDDGGGGIPLGGLLTLCNAATAVFDCGFDDYFDAAPEAGEFLATHWNVGSAVNHWLSFAQQTPSARSSASCSRLACSFADLSTDGDGSIVSRFWSFGDGGISTAANPSHDYATDGNYTLTLTVADDDGLAQSASRVVTAGTPAVPPPTTTPPPAAPPTSAPQAPGTLVAQAVPGRKKCAPKRTKRARRKCAWKRRIG